jgi:hypothetical protein
MVCSEDDEGWLGVADLRGRRALEEGVVMTAALDDQLGPWLFSLCIPTGVATNEDADRGWM